MHPSHSRQPRNASEISFADYAIALAIDVPQLALYSRVSSDLQAWMQQSRVVFAEAEDEAAKMTPELFVEYSRADEEGQAELLVWETSYVNVTETDLSSASTQPDSDQYARFSQI